MDPVQAREHIVHVLLRIAPEVAGEELVDATDLRADLELDSMYFLNLLVGVKKETGVEVPESAYAAVGTLGGLSRFVAERT